MNRRQFLNTAAGALAATPPRRPNIILILADDLGYSDLGCYGGEIRTPNLDRLAQRGIRFTHFYNAARCCPSRASIMTGLYPHQAGMGGMVAGPKSNQPLEGYRGRLNDRCVTVAQVLREAGYATLMSGKWHLGQPWPDQKGFDEYFGLLGGFDSFWSPKPYSRLPEGRPMRAYPEGQFYSTNAITDHALDFLGSARKQKKPYFLYLAYNAPHFPLHAPKDVIDQYAAMYEQGWDRIREQRFKRQREMRLVDSTWEFTPRSVIPPNRVATPHGWANKQNPAWDSVDAARRKDLARRMGVFAAMVEIMDRNIGRVVDDLRRNGELDNTLILFLSDNGACAEWDPWGFDTASGPDNILHQGAELDRMGQPGTYHSYGSAWANASNTPFRLYKHYNHEGGIAAPFIAHWPGGIARRGVFERECGHIIDLMPTFVELAGARYPSERQGSPILPMEGRSLTPAFAGKPIQRDALYWEHEGNRAMRAGRWKLAAVDAGGEWELFDMEKDPTEMHNLAASQPERVKTMAARWETWAKRTHVLPWPYGK
jgi:arylsulfatase